MKKKTDDIGSAAICLLSEHMTVVRQRIDTNVPRKRKGGTSGHDKVRSVKKMRWKKT